MREGMRVEDTPEEYPVEVDVGFTGVGTTGFSGWTRPLDPPVSESPFPFCKPQTPFYEPTSGGSGS